MVGFDLLDRVVRIAGVAPIEFVSAELDAFFVDRLTEAIRRVAIDALPRPLLARIILVVRLSTASEIDATDHVAMIPSPAGAPSAVREIADIAVLLSTL